MEYWTVVESRETAAGVPTSTFGGLESASVAEDRLSREDLGAVYDVHTKTAYKLLSDTF